MPSPKHRDRRASGPKSRDPAPISTMRSAPYRQDRGVGTGRKGTPLKLRPSRESGKKSAPENVRALVKAIFARHNPVEVASKLLNCNRPTVVARVLERLLDYKYGRPRQAIEATGPGGGPVRLVIVSHIPRPARPPGRGSVQAT